MKYINLVSMRDIESPCWKLERGSGGKGYQEYSAWIHQGEIMLDQSDSLL